MSEISNSRAVAMASSFSWATILLLFTIAIMFAKTTPIPLGASLKSGQVLGPKESLRYDGYSFVMQKDCNLVIYRVALKLAIWSTGTNGLGRNCYLKLQHDGNLIIYSRDSYAVWSSHTYHNTPSNYTLVLEKEHNVIIYDENSIAIWSIHIIP